MRYFFILLALASCKTKQVQVERVKEETIELLHKGDTIKQAAIEETTTTEFRELQRHLQDLQINYDGKSVDDKLDILLSKTEEGTKISLSGTGKATYGESYRHDLDQLAAEMMERYDFQFEQLLKAFKQESYKKDDQQKTGHTIGFQFGLYALLAVVGIVATLLFFKHR